MTVAMERLNGMIDTFLTRMGAWSASGCPRDALAGASHDRDLRIAAQRSNYAPLGN
jgi:hypothetical protein